MKIYPIQEPNDRTTKIRCTLNMFLLYSSKIYAIPRQSRIDLRFYQFVELIKFLTINIKSNCSDFYDFLNIVWGSTIPTGRFKVENDVMQTSIFLF